MDVQSAMPVIGQVLSLEEECFIPGSTKVEPLIMRWPAWTYLIPVAQYAMNLANRHVPNLQSFITNPTVHIAASSDPAMLGGPFLDLRIEDVARAKELAREIHNQCADLLEMAREIKRLDEIVRTGAIGSDMTRMYADVPPVLNGMVELVYDLNGHPKVKMLEEIIQRSALGSARKMEICLHSVSDQDRPFFLSTPILDLPNRLSLQLDFRDARIDLLAKMRNEPMVLSKVAADLGIKEEAYSTLMALCSTLTPERREPNYYGSEIRIRYFGHACLLLQTSKTTVLIDPLTAWERNSTASSLTFHDLPDRIDYVVISHHHADHFAIDMLLQLRGRIGKIIVPRNSTGSLADPSMALILKELGFSCVLSVSPLDVIEFEEGQIMSIPFVGEHADLEISSKQCVVVKIRERRFALMGDTDIVAPRTYELISAIVGKIDVLLIGMECYGAPLTWLYGALLTKPVSRKDDESRRLSGSTSAKALALVKAFGASAVFIYGMGLEPWLRHICGLQYTAESIQLREVDDLLGKCRVEGIRAELLNGCQEWKF